MKKFASLAYFSIACPQLLWDPHCPITAEKLVILFWVSPEQYASKAAKTGSWSLTFIWCRTEEYMQLYSLPHTPSSYRNRVLKMYIINNCVLKMYIIKIVC